MKVEFEGAIHDFPDDFTDADVSKALASFGKSAMTPASPKPSASSGGLLDKLKAIVGEGANAMMAESEMMTSPLDLPAAPDAGRAILRGITSGVMSVPEMAARLVGTEGDKEKYKAARLRMASEKAEDAKKYGMGGNVLLDMLEGGGGLAATLPVDILTGGIAKGALLTPAVARLFSPLVQNIIRSAPGFAFGMAGRGALTEAGDRERNPLDRAARTVGGAMEGLTLGKLFEATMGMGRGMDFPARLATQLGIQTPLGAGVAALDAAKGSRTPTLQELASGAGMGAGFGIFGSLRGRPKYDAEAIGKFEYERDMFRSELSEKVREFSKDRMSDAEINGFARAFESAELKKQGIEKPTAEDYRRGRENMTAMSEAMQQGFNRERSLNLLEPPGGMKQEGSLSNPIVAEAILKAKQERALPGPEGLDMGNVPDFQLTPSRGMADLIIEATRKRLEGKGMPLLPEPEPGPPSSPYSPELAELIRNIQEKKALPPGQGFTMPEAAPSKEDIVLRKGEPSWTEGKIPDSVVVEYRPRLSKSGAPFKTEKTARAAINKLGLQDNFVVVPVGEGFGIKRVGAAASVKKPDAIDADAEVRRIVIGDMIEMLKSGEAGLRLEQDTSGLMDVIGRFTSNPKWYGQLQKEFSSKGKGSVGKKEIILALQKEMDGRPMTGKQLAIMRIMDRHIREAEGSEYYQKLWKQMDDQAKAKAPGPVEMAAGELSDPGTKVVMDGDVFTSKGFDEEGNVVLKDGKTIRLDPFEKVKGDVLKFGKKEAGPSGGPILYSGLDPIAAAKAIRALGDDVAKAIPHLERLGRSVFDSGKRTAKDWVASMKSFLGDLWAKFREQLRDIWNNLKAMDRGKGPVGSERGSLTKGKEPDRDAVMSKTPGKADITPKTSPEAEVGEPNFKTGAPVTFDYIHNKERAPNMGERFGQHVEPAGQYIQVKPRTFKGEDFPSLEEGTVTFNNPLVVDFGGGYGEPTNWKNVLSKKYNGKTGEALSKAILKDGHDGIVTISKYGSSEIVKLPNPSRPPEGGGRQSYSAVRVSEKKISDLARSIDAEVFFDKGAFGKDRIRIATKDGKRHGFENNKEAMDFLLKEVYKEHKHSGPVLYSGVDITKIPEVLRHIRNNLKDFRPVLRERDVTLLQRIWQSPHWEAKKHPEFEAIYNREMSREQDRAKMLDARLKGWESARNLSKKDLDKLRKVIWITEGRKFKSVTEPRFVWEDNPDGRTDAKGKVLQQVKGLNKKHYRQIGDYLKGRGVPQNVIDAYVDIRKHYDKSYAMIFNKMVEMKDVDADTITKYRQEIGNISNYFPHQWYGNYYFHGLDKDGNVLVRIQYNDMAPGGFSVRHKGKLAQAKKDYPNVAEWTTPKKSRQMPEEIYEYPIPVEAMEQIISAAADRVKGVDPAAAEAFLGAMPEAVADVIKSRGFGGHMIRRKGVEGYEKQDILRVMYDFDASFSGWITKMEAARDFSSLMRDIDAKKRPGLYAYTSRYVKDVLSNADRVDRIVDGARAFFFLNFLGLNLKTGVVNGLTQNIITGIPRLSMDAGYHAVKYFKAAGDDVVAGVTKDRNLKPDEAKALDELYREGVIADQYAQEIKGQVYGRGASVLNGLNNVAGIFMSVSEKFNRASLALAAFRLAREGKISGKTALEKYGLEKGQKATYEQAIAFATDVTLDAHFSYGKGNLPEFLRGRTKILRPAYSLASFSHNLMQLWAHMLRNGGRGAAAFALSMMGTALFGGMMSVPFIKPIFEAWRRTFGTDPQKEIREKLPESVRDVVTYGTPAALGVNIGGSLEIGNVDSSNPLKWIIGVPYSVADSIGRSKRAYESGQTDRAVEEVMPTVAKNPMAAWRLYDKGQHSVSGQPINLPGETGPRKITAWEAVAKSFGFQPLSSTKARDAFEAMEDLKSFVERKQSKWANSYANAYHRDDLKEMSRIQEEVSAWNERWMKQDKPEFTISLKDAVKRRMKPEQPPRKFRGLGLQYAEEYS